MKRRRRPARRRRPVQRWLEDRWDDLLDLAAVVGLALVVLILLASR